MWAPLALSAVLSLAPAQGGNLAIKNPRPTYGLLGQERKEKEVLIGDVFTLAFDIEGLQVKEDGSIQYSVGMDLIGPDGKSQFEQKPQDLDAVNSLGGSSVPAFAIVEIRTDTKPGNYTLKITVKDRLANTSKELSYPFKIAPPTLGFVQCTLQYPDMTYRPAPPIAAPGQAYWVNFTAVGYELDKTKGNQPNFSVEMRVLDANGKPTITKTPSAVIDGTKKPVDEGFKKMVPLQFPLQLNRPGRYTIEMTIKDNVSNKTAKHTMDFQVVEPLR
jgi:hypothetical protein